MTSELADAWAKHDLPVNQPARAAQIIIGVIAEKGMNGKAAHIEGDRRWEVEGNLDKLSP